MDGWFIDEVAVSAGGYGYAFVFDGGLYVAQVVTVLLHWYVRNGMADNALAVCCYNLLRFLQLFGCNIYCGILKNLNSCTQAAI